MCSTCEYVGHMSKMIQLRNVPDDLHRRLKARSAMAGLSLSDYLIQEVRRIADQPSLEEWLERVRRLTPVKLKVSAADLVRAERDRR